MVCSRNSPEVISILEAIINKTGTLKQELLEVKNKFARTALEECVIGGNVAAATILVRAGANVSGAIKLAEEKQMKNMLNLLTNGNKDDTSSSGKGSENC